ncbi:Zn-dependent peptidase [Indivirus ILV1]|uniref:Zn-dependent peptidase n=1 Tax=Indivirus ILV1 TaxID=1977633 RepID=A0A1V0SD84_9VIRU|nr:Zn-dependent peptidase [Indivirus ILV1]
MNDHRIIKPKIDKSQYEYFQLNNKLDVVLIYDKDTDVSAAALSVGIGYNNDPEEYQGLAHFLEHMLFMGTKKYPQENYYHKKIAEWGGLANAHTMENNTTYYFQVLNEYFDDCIDLFAQFFIEPLFLEDSVNREINAVNSEYDKNITHEYVRIFGVLKELVVNNHPFYNFGIGNKETLNKPNIRNALLEFYDKYYSSNIMKLVILTNKKVKNNIIDIFSQVKNKNVKITHQIILPYENSHLIKLVPIQNSDELIIFWQIPITSKKYKPLKYISYLLGHEGQGSLYYFLKNNGLCTSLMPGIQYEDNTFQLYGINIELTEEGLKHIPFIIDCVYKYKETITISKDIYQELKITSKIQFDYSITGEKIDYVSSLAMNLLKYKPKDVICGPGLLPEYNQKFNDHLSNTLKYIKKSNEIIMIISKAYEKTTNKTEKWYGVKYMNETNPKTLGNEFIKTSLNYSPELPEKNIFIPKEKDLKMINPKGLQIKKYPLELKPNLYYMFSSSFEIPKIFCNLILYNDNFYKNAKDNLLLSLYLGIIQERLTYKLYNANVVGTGYNALMNSNCININFFGYIGGIDKIIDLFIDAFLNIEITEQEFNLEKYELDRNLKNFIYNQPFLIANDYFKEKLYLINHTNDELITMLNKITFKEINKPKSFKWDVKTFVYGNIDQHIVNEFNQKCEIFNSEIKTKRVSKIYKLQDGEQHTYIKKSLNPEEKNNLIYLFCEIGNVIKKTSHDWDITILCTHLIELILREKFFTELRTVEQTGYIVKTNVRYYEANKGDVIGIVFMIQSHIYPNILRKKIKKFIEKQYNGLKDESNEYIDQLKKTLKTSIEVKFDSPYEEYDFMSNEIISQEYIYDYKELVLKNIDKIDKQMLLDFYDKYLIDKKTRKIRILEMYKHDL